MLYSLLLVTLFGLWIVAFKVNNCELMAPVPLMLLGLTVSAALSIIGLSTWNQVSLGVEGYAVVVIGSIFLLLGSLFCVRALDKRNIRFCREDDTEALPVGMWKFVLVAVVLVFAIALRVFETYRIADELGIDGSSYSESARAVREVLAGFKSSEGIKVGVGFSLFERQLEKIATVSGYVSVYLFARALIEENKKDGFASLVLLVLACAFCFVTGSRGTILYYGVAFAACLFVLLRRKGVPSLKISACFLACGIVISCLAAIIFYLSGAAVGRSTNSGIVEYISFYYGCGVPALQHILDSEIVTNSISGVRTFYYLLSVPFKLGIVQDYPSYSIAWVDMGGHLCNIFTGFARYYLDFGFIGTALLTFVSGAFMTAVFRVATSTALPVAMVLMSYLGAYAFDFAREEFIFSKLLSPTQCISVAIMIIITLFLTTSLRRDLLQIGAFLSKKADS